MYNVNRRFVFFKMGCVLTVSKWENKSRAKLLLFYRIGKLNQCLMHSFTLSRSFIEYNAFLCQLNCFMYGNVMINLSESEHAAQMEGMRQFYEQIPYEGILCTIWKNMLFFVCK